jgi:Fungal domain of unknown function (DUF1750)
MVFLPKDILPPDGVVWMEKETRFQMPKVPGGVDVECYQTTQGYIPGNDSIVCRVRRRFRLPGHRGFSPNLWLVHYIRSTHSGPRMLSQYWLALPTDVPRRSYNGNDSETTSRLPTAAY